VEKTYLKPLSSERRKELNKRNTIGKDMMAVTPIASTGLFLPREGIGVYKILISSEVRDGRKNQRQMPM
jgi:hypothetical protein